MSFVSGTTGNEAAQKFLEVLQNDFRNLSLETRKRYPQIRESCEEAIVKLRSASANPQTPVFYVINQILYPLVQGCESKDVKIIKFCLGMIQRLITQQVVDPKGARYITDTLWMLMQSGTEEVRLLQSVTLLLTTNTVVHGDTLARTLVLCFRLHFTKDSTTINTAGATVRQLVSLVFERVLAEEAATAADDSTPVQVNLEELKTPSNTPPKGLKPCAADAYLMFQDLVQLVNADQPYWLIGMTEMTRTFGLELLESVLTNFSEVFFKNPEFSFLLKERVCALVIKLFSPNIKYRSMVPAQSAPLDKPYFPISVRLLRVVAVLIQKYHSLLVTECEIFLSLIVKFLEPDKPPWQRTLALQVLHRLCVSPSLVHSLCQSYDLQPHATNIFQDIVNSLGAYVQSLFVVQMGQNVSSASPSSQTGVLSMNSQLQPGFFYRGIWLPIIGTVTRGQARATYLEMLDKIEPPVIPEGYGISIAYACLLDIVQSVSSIMQNDVNAVSNKMESLNMSSENLNSDEATEVSTITENESMKLPDLQYANTDLKFYTQLINSSWCGLLAAFVPLIESSTDEQTTENILKAIQIFTGLCGTLELNNARDAFITAICKASLPANYSLTILNMSLQNASGGRTHSRNSSQDLNNQYSVPFNDCDYKQQVVVVGTPLPTASMPVGAQQGPVMLTAKNLQCMRSLLTLSHNYGTILGTAWHIVLSTLQHLVWILGLKPSTGGSLKAARTSSDSNAVITTAVMADLPVLSTMLSRLFESSRGLNDVALHHLIDALCQLSLEAMELAYSNREPSLFAVAKLLETGLVNLSRIEVLWRPLTNHLLEVCRHPHIRMREWGVEAVTYLVKASLQHKYPIPLKENQRLQTLLLGPLAELNSVHHVDVREGQLDCVLQILHGCGETLSYGWPLVLGIIGAVSEHHGENLIRVAFQCLQLVVTDFLPIMPCNCLPLCVDTAAKFGSQTQELNISLTAVGLMWNISDYFYQNQEKLCVTLNSDSAVLPDFPGTPNMPPFDKLWMCLYVRLGDLCVDSRPAVRKSAGQTLFSTISAHGSLLNHGTWQSVLWLVLFPLLDKVRSLSSSASNEKVDTSGNILIHHSRNTAQKQWAETQVLTLSGVARVFNTKRQLLQMLGDFPKAWSLLLEFIEHSALSKNNEVSLAALKSFQEILYINKTESKNENSNTAINNVSEEPDVWNVAWKVWLSIGVESTMPPEANDKEDVYIPSQGLLTALVQIFPAVFQHIRNIFTVAHLNKLCMVLLNTMSVPISNDTISYMMPALNDLAISPLQDGVLHCMQLLQKEAMSSSMKLNVMVVPIFKQLLNFSTFACTPPSFGNIEPKNITNVRANSAEWLTMNFVPFGEKSLQVAVKLYQSTAFENSVINGNILYEIIKALHLPLSLKYNCISNTTWKLAISSLLAVLKTGLPVARANSQHFSDMWTELYETLDHFLFPKCVMGADRGLDDLVTDEAIDCQVIELLRTEVLPYSHCMPKQFILKIVVLLNKGSIHSATGSNMDSETELKLREEFAKTCFETLLQFSLLDNGDIESGDINGTSGIENEGGVAGRLAVTALLYRFQEVLKKYTEDERQSGKCPLPRYRMSEISFVLKAVATLVISMKNAPLGKVDVSAWHQLIGLYPYLVECTVTASPQVSRSLRECLLQYSDLLQPPLPGK